MRPSRTRSNDRASPLVANGLWMQKRPDVVYKSIEMSASIYLSGLKCVVLFFEGYIKLVILPILSSGKVLAMVNLK